MVSKQQIRQIVRIIAEEWEAWRDDPYALVHEIRLTGKTLYESAQPTRLVLQG